jgi:S1-C subfamily serine protease
MGGTNCCEVDKRNDAATLHVHSHYRDTIDGGLPAEHDIDLTAVHFNGSTEPQSPMEVHRWEILLDIPEEENLDLTASLTSLTSLTSVGRFGISLAEAPNGALVDVIKPGGIIDTFNKSEPDKAIREGDVILEANGVSGSWELVKEEFFSGRSVGLKLERGAVVREKLEWMMEIDGGFSSLGIDFDDAPAAEKTSLRISVVHADGVIPKHNARNPMVSVRKGDLIVQVNDESASALAMLQEIERASSEKGDSLKIYLVRKKMKRQVSFARALSMDFDEEQIMAQRGVVMEDGGGEKERPSLAERASDASLMLG